MIIMIDGHARVKLLSPSKKPARKQNALTNVELLGNLI